MKNLIRVFTLFLFVFSLFSCNSDDDGNEKKSTFAQKATDEAKWISTATNSKFASLEFNNSGNYIIIENVLTKSTTEQKLYFGTYKITDGSTISLSGMGTIKVIDVTGNAIGMEITLNGTSTPIAFSGSRSANMSETAKTDLLCRTWEIIKYNGETVKGTVYENATILFSGAGTYFTYLPYEEDYYVHGGLALWKWKPGTDETQILYTWDSSFESDDEVSFVTINTLTGTSLKITEEFEDGEIGVYEMEAVINTKAMIVKSGTNNISGKGFLGKRYLRF